MWFTCKRPKCVLYPPAEEVPQRALHATVNDSLAAELSSQTLVTLSDASEPGQIQNGGVNDVASINQTVAGSLNDHDKIIVLTTMGGGDLVLETPCRFYENLNQTDRRDFLMARTVSCNRIQVGAIRLLSPARIRRTFASNRLLALVVSLSLFFAIAGCGSNDATGQEVIDLSTLHPNNEGTALKPGGSYEFSFSPQIDGLEVSVNDTPEGVTALVEPDPGSDNQILVIDVDETTQVASPVVIQLDVDNQGTSTTVNWPFDIVEQN